MDAKTRWKTLGMALITVLNSQVIQFASSQENSSNLSYVSQCIVNSGLLDELQLAECTPDDWVRAWEYYYQF